MNPERLLKHFEDISEAEDAVPRLRQFVLELAVRGKLVEQDADDVPAFELMNRIEGDKARLAESGKLKLETPLAPIDTIPYAIPQTWIWVRLGITGRIFNGNSVSEGVKRTLARVKDGYPFVATKDVGYGRDELNYDNGLRVPRREVGYKVAHKDAVLICAEGGSAGRKIGITDRDICFGNKLYANEVWDGINPRYVFYVYQTPSFFNEFASRMTGIIGGIARSEFVMLPVPVPPEKEQHRIVAKVDKLMALCDELEAARTKRESRRDHLVAATLHRLNNGDTSPEAGNDTDFKQTARFYFNHLPRITTRPEHIKQLRQTIHSLAVQGKLIQQDPADEPVDHLLTRIHLERAKLNRTATSAVQRIEGGITLGYDIPKTWKWRSLDDLLVFGPTNGFSPKAVDFKTSVRSLTLSATTSGHFKEEHSKYIATKIPSDSDLWLKDGDILVQRGNTIEYVGVAAIYRGEPNRFIYPDLMMKIRVSSELNLRYVHLAMSQDAARDFLRARASGTSGTMPKINQTTLKSLPLPIPPAAEQHRIVAKVNELMALCDELEAQLTTTATTRWKLLEATLHEALASESHSVTHGNITGARLGHDVHASLGD